MEHFVASWGYVALFAITMLSAMGIPVGSEIVIAYAGALAGGLSPAGGQHLQLAVVIVLATLGDVVGAYFGYVIGRIGGRPLIERVGKYILLTRVDLDHAEAWFAKRGDSFVFFARLVPFLRSFVSVAAGVAEMPVLSFTAFTTAACAIWCGAIAGLGYGLGSSWSHVLKDFSDAGYGIAALIIVGVATAFTLRPRRVRLEQRALGARRDESSLPVR